MHLGKQLETQAVKRSSHVVDLYIVIPSPIILNTPIFPRINTLCIYIRDIFIARVLGMFGIIGEGITYLQSGKVCKAHDKIFST